MIHSARLKLTLAYTAGIALIMAAFSVVLYVALTQLAVNNLDVGGDASSRVEQVVLAAELTRARLVLVGANVVGWILSAAVSYVIAGRTLRPIEASIERQRQFTAHASHELRTPLTIMEGEIDVTLARERSPEEYRQTLALVHTEVDNMKHSVDDLLTLAQVDARREVIGRERRSVAEMVDEMVRPRLSILKKKEIRLTTDVPPRLEASLDWERIQHLLRNLLDNAVSYTPRRGEIRIEACQRGSDLELQVFNSGSHIEARDFPHLFVPFYRGRGSVRGAGSGLGLALCDWVARAHAGSITAENRPGGVAFVVRLPRAT